MLVSVKKCKVHAIEVMERIGLSCSYIDAFRDQNKVSLFGSSVSVIDDPFLLSKIKEIESSYHCVVFAACYNRFFFGDCYSFLIVSRYDEDWFFSYSGSHFFLPAYVLNMTHEECSEFGSVEIRSRYGLISRIS